MELATGGDPEGALLGLLEPYHGHAGQAFRATVEHDGGCPCENGCPMRQCTCEIVAVTIRDIT